MSHDGVQAGETTRFWLRGETRRDHEALHHHASFKRLASGEIDRAGYSALMLRQLGFYRRMDAVLAAGLAGFGPDDPILSHQPRAGLIEADLDALGVGTGHAPSIDGLATVASAAELRGVLYVIEGAMLGASVLAKEAARFAGRDGRSGASFWMWSRDACPHRWPRACALIDGPAETPRDRATMLAAARRTFGLYGAWFAPLDHALAETM